jgi:16S rRNA (uracil1498-N3)-methyltransferase
MPQFFIKASNIIGNKCIIEDEDCYHLQRVRRAKAGDLIDLRDEDGIIYKGRISSIDSKSIIVEIIENVVSKSNETDLNLTLYISILKGKVFDLALQKAVEIGVNRIVPVVTERTIPVIDRSRNKKTRWEKIAINASKQCMRNDIPVIGDMLTFTEALVNDSSGIKIIAHPDKRGKDIKEYLSQKNKSETVSLLIGPEGGFTDKELKTARDNYWDQVVFGFTSLRAETASIVLPAILIYEWSNSNQEKDK